MTIQSQTLLEAAMQLSEVERSALAERLLESVSLDPADDIRDEDWLMELDRRYAELEQDPKLGISWSELKNEDLG